MLDDIAETAKRVLSMTPPELVSDLYETGATLGRGWISNKRNERKNSRKN